MAAGQSLVIITRNIDLSVGSIAGVSAYLTGDVLGDHLATPPVVAVLLAVAIGTLLGLVNGALVAYGRIPSIIVTLGTLAIYRTWLISYAEAARSRPARCRSGSSTSRARRCSPSASTSSARCSCWRSSSSSCSRCCCSLRAGRILYAIGSNPEAARQAGLPVRRTTVAAFTACGALAGLGGFLVLARFGTLTVSAGQGLELESIAASVVGGVSTLGGSGTIVGSFFGAVLIGLLDQSLGRVPQVSEFMRDAVLGLLILLAVVLDGLLPGGSCPGARSCPPRAPAPNSRLFRPPLARAA